MGQSKNQKTVKTKRKIVEQVAEDHATASNKKLRLCKKGMSNAKQRSPRKKVSNKLSPKRTQRRLKLNQDAKNSESLNNNASVIVQNPNNDQSTVLTDSAVSDNMHPKRSVERSDEVRGKTPPVEPTCSYLDNKTRTTNKVNQSTPENTDNVTWSVAASNDEFKEEIEPFDSVPDSSSEYSSSDNDADSSYSRSSPSCASSSSSSEDEQQGRYNRLGVRARSRSVSRTRRAHGQSKSGR